MNKIRVGVIFGGCSGEHEISLRSAESVLTSLDRSKYDVVPIGISHEGKWLQSRNALAVLPPKETIAMTLSKGEPIVVTAEPETGAIVTYSFLFFTEPMARTARSRVCSSSRTYLTWAPAC